MSDLLKKREREQYNEAMEALRLSQTYHEKDLMLRGLHPSQLPKQEDDDELSIEDMIYLAMTSDEDLF